MAIFKVCAAFDVCVYINLKVEADNLEDALKQLKAMDADDSLWDDGDVDYGSADEHRIVEITDAHDEVLVESLFMTDDEWEEIPVTPVT
jgi:hypothetical protein